MSDVESQAMAVPAVGPAVTPDPAAIWSEHIRGAVKEFLKTAVVIDNEPSVQKHDAAQPAKFEASADSGFGDELPPLEAPIAAAKPEDQLHILDLRAISDAFISQGIACAFVLPDDQDLETSLDQKIERAVAAAKISDLVVIDWYLANRSESLTLQILKRIAESDAGENGRLRLICVYTGEPLKDSILEEITKSLKEGGITVKKNNENGYCAVGENTIVAIFNKSETDAKKLPGELIKLFSHFADGLIPAFSLAAVGAIRKNAHHMLTRFGKVLDSAYIANRIITNPPSDVSEMMRDLFVSECDAAIGLESVADKYLEKSVISKWLDFNENKIKPHTYKPHLTLNKTTIKNFLEYGIKNGKAFKDKNGEIKFPEDDRHLISTVLSGSIESSETAEREFARLVVMKREAFGRSKLLGSRGWLPSLTIGTLLKLHKKAEVAEVAELAKAAEAPEVPKVAKATEATEATEAIEAIEAIDIADATDATDEYLICFRPACDNIRLAGPTPFVFLHAKPNKEEYGLVVREAENKDLLLQLDKGNPCISTFHFTPDTSLERVIATQSTEGNNEFFFTDCNGNKFTWLGEIRYSRAVSEISRLLQNWMRIGVCDSEFLRKTSEGDYKSRYRAQQQQQQ